jgi:glycosyltransferase involved in cell wall biosynthesis
MKIKLIHIASSHQMGLTNQETQLALAYRNVSDIDALVVTGEHEQYEGCFNLLKKNGISNQIIKGFDDHHEFFRLITEFIKIVNSFGPDIVSVNTNWHLVLVGIVRYFSNKKKFKIIYTVHGFRHNSRFKSLFARFFIGTALFIFANVINAPTTYVKNKFSFLAKKIKTIPLGEDEIFFVNSACPDFSKPLNFVFPGVFRFGKNQEMLILAFFEYLKLSKDETGTLFLPGDGELRTNAMKLATDLGIADRVNFPGQLNRQEILTMYLKCQVAIIPSNDETFGHCIAEPLVMQRIVISRNIGLAPDFLVNGDNGFIFSDKSELVQNLLHVNSMTQDDLMSISRAAGLAGTQFNWENIARRHLKELFEPVLHQNK